MDISSQQSQANTATSAKLLYLMLAILAYGAVGLAVLLQGAYDWAPCPWCILQRYAYLLLGTLFLARAISTTQGFGGWLSATTVSAFAGAGMAAFQLYVKFNPKVSCGRDAVALFVNDLLPAKAWPMLFEATGSCADPIPVNFPVLSLIGFVLLFAGTLYVRRRAGR